MNERELRAAIGYVRAVMSDMLTRANGAPLTGDEATRFEEGASAIEAWNTQLETIVAQRSRLDGLPAVEGADEAPETDPLDVTAATRTGNRGRTDADLYDLRSIPALGRRREEVARDVRARALTAIERSTHFAADDHKENLTRRLERADGIGAIAQRAIAGMNPHYVRAWTKLMAGEAHLMDGEERQAVAAMRAAMQVGDDAKGGYAVPTFLDPTLILLVDGYTDPISRLARTVDLSYGNTWTGVTTAGVSAGYAAELAVSADDSPNDLASPSIPTHMGDAFVQYSIQAEQDIDGLVGDLIDLFAYAIGEARATMRATGSGSNQPTGLITGLVAADSGSRIQASATTDTLAKADFYALKAKLGPAYNGPSVMSILAHGDIIDTAAQMSQGEFEGFFSWAADGSPRILRRPAYDTSKMDGTVTATANNYVAVAGDIAKAYTVVNKMGMNVERIDHVLDASTNRPKGQRGMVAYWRDGAAVVNYKAAAVLNVT